MLEERRQAAIALAIVLITCCDQGAIYARESLSKNESEERESPKGERGISIHDMWQLHAVKSQWETSVSFYFWFS